jgi:hypothetical protein
VFPDRCKRHQLKKRRIFVGHVVVVVVVVVITVKFLVVVVVTPAYGRCCRCFNFRFDRCESNVIIVAMIIMVGAIAF